MFFTLLGFTLRFVHSLTSVIPLGLSQMLQDGVVFPISCGHALHYPVTVFLVVLMFLKISIMRANFEFFSIADRIFIEPILSLPKTAEAGHAIWRCQ